MDKTDREVMKQALEALERARPQIRGVLPSQDADAAITNLRARLAEPVPQTCKPALQVEGAEAEPHCGCHKCNEGVTINGIPFASARMILCPTCGNKRCPHASDHRLACTDSNKPGQAGSVYATVSEPL